MFAGPGRRRVSRTVHRQRPGRQVFTRPGRGEMRGDALPSRAVSVEVTRYLELAGYEPNGVMFKWRFRRSATPTPTEPAVAAA